MKTLLILLITTLTLLGCSSKTFVPSDDMQQIKSTAKTLTLKVDEKAYFQGSVHGSVGETVEVHIENEAVIKVADYKLDYNNPDHAEMAGGDSAKKTFILKALTAGETKITIKNLFRGDVKSEQIISCVVSK